MNQELATVLNRVKSIRHAANYAKPDGDMQDLLTLADSHDDLLETLKAIRPYLLASEALIADAAIAKATI